MKDLSELATAQTIVSNSWTMTSENFFTFDATTHGNSFESLYTSYQTGTSVDIVFGQRGGTPSQTPEDDGSDQPSGGWTPGTLKFTGKAFVTSLDLNAPAGDDTTYTVTFTGTGKLSMTTV